MELIAMPLAGASITLEVASAEVQVAVGVIEQSLALEVAEAGRDVIVAYEPAPIEVVEVLMGGGGGEAPVDPVYERRADVVSPDLAYRAEAMPGSSDNSPVWRVRRIVVADDGTPDVRWAGNNPHFAYAWSERATLSYE